MKAWDAVATKDSVEKTLKALNENCIEAKRAANREEARKMVLSMIPEGAEVFTMTSVTLDTIGVAREINESGRFNSVRKALMGMDPKIQAREQRKLGAAPDVTVGSVHAVTETGTAMIASRTGSQLPAYAYGAGTVIWVVGAQKIVKDVEEGMKRINEYLVGKESERAIKAYGLPAEFKTFPSKVLLFNREVQPGRVKVIIVDEAVGN
jgi:L-lactate utilization protein LutC